MAAITGVSSVSTLASYLQSFQTSLPDCPPISSFISVDSSNYPFVHDESALSQFLFKVFCSQTPDTSTVLSFFDSFSRPFGSVISSVSDLSLNDHSAFLHVALSYSWHLLPLPSSSLSDPMSTSLLIFCWNGLLPASFENISPELFSSPRCSLILATIVYLNSLRLLPASPSSAVLGQVFSRSVTCDLLLKELQASASIVDNVTNLSEFSNNLTTRISKICDKFGIFDLNTKSSLHNLPKLSSTITSSLISDCSSDLDLLVQRLEQSCLGVKSLSELLFRFRVAFGSLKKPLPDLSLFSIDSLTDSIKNVCSDVSNTSVLIEMIESLSETTNFFSSQHDSLQLSSISKANSILSQLEDIVTNLSSSFNSEERPGLGLVSTLVTGLEVVKEAVEVSFELRFVRVLEKSCKVFNGSVEVNREVEMVQEKVERYLFEIPLLLQKSLSFLMFFSETIDFSGLLTKELPSQITCNFVVSVLKTRLSSLAQSLRIPEEISVDFLPAHHLKSLYLEFTKKKPFFDEGLSYLQENLQETDVFDDLLADFQDLASVAERRRKMADTRVEIEKMASQRFVELKSASDGIFDWCQSVVDSVHQSLSSVNEFSLSNVTDLTRIVSNHLVEVGQKKLTCEDNDDVISEINSSNVISVVELSKHAVSAVEMALRNSLTIGGEVFDQDCFDDVSSEYDRISNLINNISTDFEDILDDCDPEDQGRVTNNFRKLVEKSIVFTSILSRFPKSFGNLPPFEMRTMSEAIAELLKNLKIV
ncbi:hypothetical protein GEMRC1_011727 [Eukaryota sp. GEM-RC1]